jgi:hypothetical protein
MDPELRAYLEEQRTTLQELRGDFQELRSDFQEQRAYVEERFKKVEESDRHTRILVAGLRDDFRLLAEGFVGFQESWQADKADLMREIGDVKSLLITSYSDLNSRVTALESWRERRDRNPVAVIREWLGKPR